MWFNVLRWIGGTLSITAGLIAVFAKTRVNRRTTVWGWILFAFVILGFLLISIGELFLSINENILEGEKKVDRLSYASKLKLGNSLTKPYTGLVVIQ